MCRCRRADAGVRPSLQAAALMSRSDGPAGTAALASCFAAAHTVSVHITSHASLPDLAWPGWTAQLTERPGMRRPKVGQPGAAGSARARARAHGPSRRPRGGCARSQARAGARPSHRRRRRARAGGRPGAARAAARAAAGAGGRGRVAAGHALLHRGAARRGGARGGGPGAPGGAGVARAGRARGARAPLARAQ